MRIDDFMQGMAEGDPGKLLKQELEEGLEPIISRVNNLEKKIDLLLLTLSRIETILIKLQPLSAFFAKIPFLK